MKKTLLLFMILIPHFIFATGTDSTPVNLPFTTSFELVLDNGGTTTIYFSDADKNKLQDKYIYFPPVEDPTKAPTATTYLYFSIFEQEAVTITVTQQDYETGGVLLDQEGYGLSSSDLVYLNYDIIIDSITQDYEDPSYTITSDPNLILKKGERNVPLSKKGRSVSFNISGVNDKYTERSALIKLTLELNPPSYDESQGDAFMAGIYNGYLIVEMKSQE